MNDHLTPFQVCEALIGGPAQIGEILGYDRTAAFAWRHATSTRDAGDLPSAKLMRRLLAYSSARGLGLSADHLIWGAPRVTVNEILSHRIPVQEAAE